MNSDLPPPVFSESHRASEAALVAPARRPSVTAKLLFIAFLVVLLQVPLFLINSLLEDRQANRTPTPAAAGRLMPETATETRRPNRVDLAGGNVSGREGAASVTGSSTATSPAPRVFEAYRMVNRALKYGALVLSLVFAAFFLFEAVAGVRLHAVHYALVGAAMCLFYLALLALGEVIAPGLAYAGAAVASSALIVSYSAAILRSRARAVAIAALLASVHSILYVVLRMEAYALLAGTAALFVALGAVMFFTRHVDWHSQDAAPARA